MNRLNKMVSIDEWVLGSSIRGGRNPYLPRRWLAESYALLDAVRHVGPRRRAEMRVNTAGSEDERQRFKETWEGILGHPLTFKEDERMARNEEFVCNHCKKPNNDTATRGGMRLIGLDLSGVGRMVE